MKVLDVVANTSFDPKEYKVTIENSVGQIETITLRALCDPIDLSSLLHDWPSVKV